MRLLGKIEIGLGLLLVALGVYFLLEHLLAPHVDRHGWLIVVGNFGVLLGGLLAFAGAMLAFTSRLRFLWHLPLLVVCGIYFIAFREAFV